MNLPRAAFLAVVTAILLFGAIPEVSATYQRTTDVNVTSFTIIDGDHYYGDTQPAPDRHDLTVTQTERDVTFINYASFQDSRDDGVQRRLIITQYIEDHTDPEEVYNELYTPPFSDSTTFDLDFEVEYTGEETHYFNVVVNIEGRKVGESSGLISGGGVVATVNEDDGIIP